MVLYFCMNNTKQQLNMNWRDGHTQSMSFGVYAIPAYFSPLIFSRGSCSLLS